jgi:hypothetical protein
MADFLVFFSRGMGLIMDTLNKVSQRTGIPVLPILFGAMFVRLLYTVITINSGGGSEGGESGGK